MTAAPQPDVAPPYATQPAHPHHHHGWWWKTLLSGLLLWIITIVVTAVTRNTNLVPTLILLGSFLVPFCVVLFVVERVTGNVSSLQLMLAFFIGGIFGVLGASLLEADLHQTLWIYVLIGLIEEFVKLAVLVVVGWRVVPKTATQGALLGATVGAGFAAFESAGYAFNAAITSHGINLYSLLQTEAVRAILAPVGHILWTAIIGAVLFGSARLHERYRWSWWIPVAFLGAALLHAFWDSASDIASVIALLFTGGAVQQLENGFLLPSTAQAVQSLATILYIVALALAAVIAILALVLVLRHYRKRDRAIVDAAAAPAVAPPYPAQ